MSNRILKLSTILIISVFTGCTMFMAPQPENNPVAIFENLWTTFNEEYAPFEERGVDWQAEYTKFRSQVSPTTTDEELFDALTQLLATLDDGHVSLTTPGRDVFFANEVRRTLRDNELFDLDVIKENYLDSDYESGEEDSYIYGRIRNENIAYAFFKYVGVNFQFMEKFLQDFNQVDGYIIDLRHNQGGDFTYAFPEIGRFTDTQRLAFRSKTKNGPAPNDYTPWTEWYIKPKHTYIDKPIVVLTDRYTISAGERAVMAFKTIPTVTLVGDTTNGAHGTMIGRELANGWFYSLVPQKVELYDGKSYEGIGIAPDIYIKNDSLQMAAGIDQTIQLAIDQLH